VNIDKARALASQTVVHPNEAQTASLVVNLAILDELIAARLARSAPTPDEKPGKGAKVKS
jgi:hypothetical protein